MHQDTKSAQLIVVCKRTLRDHGQQPMKMHTEVTLLYKCKLYTFDVTLHNDLLENHDYLKLL